MEYVSDLQGYFLEDLSIGMSEVYSKTVSEADIVLFAGVSGDTNPLHLDEQFAARSIFGGRIAHGMLSASFISTIFGTRLPGPGSIYMSQNLRFKAPVKAGDTVVARVTVREIDAKRKRVQFDCACHVGERVVIDGDAMIMVPSRADSAGG